MNLNQYEAQMQLYIQATRNLQESLYSSLGITPERQGNTLQASLVQDLRNYHQGDNRRRHTDDILPYNYDMWGSPGWNYLEIIIPASEDPNDQKHMYIEQGIEISIFRYHNREGYCVITGRTRFPFERLWALTGHEIHRYELRPSVGIWQQLPRDWEYNQYVNPIDLSTLYTQTPR